MKTFQQKVNSAKRKVMKISSDLEGILTKMDTICEDLEDDDFSDKMGEITEVIGGVIDGDSRVSFPDVIEYLDEISEREVDEE